MQLADSMTQAGDCVNAATDSMLGDFFHHGVADGHGPTGLS